MTPDYTLSNTRIVPVIGFSLPDFFHLTTNQRLFTAIFFSSYVNLKQDIFFMRGNDSAAGFVYWSSAGYPDLYPTVTSPVLQGILENAAVVYYLTMNR